MSADDRRDDELGGDPACWAHVFDDPPADDATAFPSGRGSSGVVVVDLGAVDTSGVDGAVWSLPHGGDLDANLVRLGPGGAIGEHVNDEVDVLVFVHSGAGVLSVDGRAEALRGDVVALIPRGSRRSVVAGERGMTYLTVHRRRGPLTIGGR